MIFRNPLVFVDGRTREIQSNDTLNPSALTSIINDSSPSSDRVYSSQKVEQLLSSNNNSLPVGSLICTSSPNPIPNGFLPCNGTWVSKTTYSNLFSVIGDTYSFKINPGNGKPWKMQYEFNNSSITLGNWLQGTPLPAHILRAQAAVTKNRIYLIGGTVGTSFNNYSNKIYSCTINPDGSLGNWTQTGTLPDTLAFSQLLVHSNKMFLIGGNTGNGYTRNVYWCNINPDGTITNFSTLLNSLPIPIAASTSLIIKNKIYLFGGVTNTGFIANVLMAEIQNGNISRWKQSYPLPIPLIQAQAVVIKEKVYVIGGRIQGEDTIEIIFVASINKDGSLSPWVFYNKYLPFGVDRSQSVVIKNRIYLIGGIMNYNWSNSIISAPIDEDGNIGDWIIEPKTLPSPQGLSQVVVVNNRIYTLGGTDGPQVYYNTFNGGTNDYSPYYGTQSISDTSQNDFRLPDFSLKKEENMYYFIKY